MTISLKTTAIGALTALAMSTALATPASAWCNGWGCGGWGPGPAVAVGVLGGMALGAAAAGAANGPYYGPGPGCWMELRPVYDAYGNFLGRRRVRICH